MMQSVCSEPRVWYSHVLQHRKAPLDTLWILHFLILLKIYFMYGCFAACVSEHHAHVLCTRGQKGALDPLSCHVGAGNGSHSGRAPVLFNSETLLQPILHVLYRFDFFKLTFNLDI